MDKIGVVLAVVLPLCGVILSIALKMISNKKREVLPCCKEKFTGIETDIKEMKKGSTDRASIVTAIKAAMDLLKEKTDESGENYKILQKSIHETSKEVAIISENIKHLSKIVEEISQNGKNSQKNNT